MEKVYCYHCKYRKITQSSDRCIKSAYEVDTYLARVTRFRACTSINKLNDCPDYELEVDHPRA